MLGSHYIKMTKVILCSGTQIVVVTYQLSIDANLMIYKETFIQLQLQLH